MTTDNMRALGVRSIDVTCLCGREAIIDVSGFVTSSARRVRAVEVS
jgi:hypothetical protein